MSADPRSFSRGKRGIAGSLIFTIFDRNPLSALANRTQYHYWAKEDEMTNPDNYGGESAVAKEALDRSGLPLGIRLQAPIYEDQSGPPTE